MCCLWCKIFNGSISKNVRCAIHWVFKMTAKFAIWSGNAYLSRSRQTRHDSNTILTAESTFLASSNTVRQDRKLSNVGVTNKNQVWPLIIGCSEETVVGQHPGMEWANLPGVQGAGPAAERMEIDLFGSGLCLSRNLGRGSCLKEGQENIYL